MIQDEQVALYYMMELIDRGNLDINPIIVVDDIDDISPLSLASYLPSSFLVIQH